MTDKHGINSEPPNRRTCPKRPRAPRKKAWTPTTSK